MWLMILIAVHLNDPKDIPGRVTIEFPDQTSCEQSLKTITWSLKFDSFKVDAKCVKRS
jgi:hypothetical protein